MFQIFSDGFDNGDRNLTPPVSHQSIQIKMNSVSNVFIWKRVENTKNVLYVGERRDLLKIDQNMNGIRG